MSGKVYGYARVSTCEQNVERQLIAFTKAGVDACDIFIDKQSGSHFSRPEYKRMMRRLRAGDLIVIKSLDRLGRNYTEVQEQWRIITKSKGADILVLDMPLLDTRQKRDLIGSFIADIVLQVLSFAAENERANIRSRQAEGIAAAKARGVHCGRSADPTPPNFDIVAQMWSRRELTLDKASRSCGMSRSTFYKKAMTFIDRTIE